MIWESAPWKQKLLRDAGRIRRLAKAKFAPEEENNREYVRIERLIFITAYSMRKLWESNKLSTNWNDQKLPCVKYPIKGDVPDRFNWHEIDRHYDLNAEQAVSIRPEEFCDRIIHSFIFLLQLAENDTPSCIYFASDRTRKKSVWRTNLNAVADLVQRTGHDYPNSSHFVRGADGQWIIWSGDEKPPKDWTGNKALKEP
jgi:hypothetical protein